MRWTARVLLVALAPGIVGDVDLDTIAVASMVLSEFADVVPMFVTSTVAPGIANDVDVAVDSTMATS